jgi:hypothetical protein
LLSLRAIAVRTIRVRTVTMWAITMRAITIGSIPAGTVGLRAITVRAIAPGAVGLRAMTVRTVAGTMMLALRLPLAGRLVAIVALHPLAVAILAWSVVALMMLTTVATLRPALSARLVTAMLGAAMTRAAMLGTMAAARAATTAALTATLAPLLVLRLLRYCRLRHVLVGRGLQHGEALVGQPLDALELAALAAVAERQSDARSAGARGAADAMDVALGLGRQLVVDDVGHALHIDGSL